MIVLEILTFIVDGIGKIISFFSLIFWKSKDVVYIHSNKKIMDFSHLTEEKIDLYDSKIINFQYVSLKNKFSKYKFWKQKMYLYQISKNKASKSKITYSGFVSTPLAVFDGYYLRDTRKYNFVSLNSKNSKPYKCEFAKSINDNAYKINMNNVDASPEVCLLINSSKKINETTCKNYPKIVLNLLNMNITEKYLNEVYNCVYKTMENFNKRGVKTIHLYVAAQQPVAFVIGLAIQPYHPNVIAYEFQNGEYVWGLNIKTKKVKYV